MVAEEQNLTQGDDTKKPAEEPVRGKGVGGLIRRLKGGTGQAFQGFNLRGLLNAARTFIREFRFTKRIIFLCQVALAGALTTILGILIGSLIFYMHKQSKTIPNVPIPPGPVETSLAGSTLSEPDRERFNRIFYSFSVLAEEAFLPNLGLEDKNHNGLIERGKGEGYEAFIGKYGNADQGFWVNTVLQGTGNGVLEEAELINHYYLHIRYSFPEETGVIEGALRDGVRKRELPLVWLDDRNGTALKAVQAIFQRDRLPWPTGPVREAEAEELFQRVLRGFRVRGLTGDPGNTGYYQLPDFTRYRSGYCFEVAQFGFWFFSLLKINALPATAMLTPQVKHQVIKLISTNGIIDYFGAGDGYRITADQWRIDNPLQSLGVYYATEAQKQRRRRGAVSLYEQAVTYNKYNLTYLCSLMDAKTGSPNPNYQELIAIGEFALQNVDIPAVMSSQDLEADQIRANFELILSILVQSYSAMNDRRGFDVAAGLLNEYFYDDDEVQPFLNQYRF